jgi:hypothetical protein
VTIDPGTIQPGARVLGSDDDLVGRVDQVDPNYVAVERDAMGLPTVYVPAEAVAGIDEAHRAVKLTIPADAVDEKDWTDPPR